MTWAKTPALRYHFTLLEVAPHSRLPIVNLMSISIFKVRCRLNHVIVVSSRLRTHKTGLINNKNIVFHSNPGSTLRKTSALGNELRQSHHELRHTHNLQHSYVCDLYRDDTYNLL
jgi:hypothetical protein